MDRIIVKRMRRSSCRNAGLSLVELLVAVAIVGVIMVVVGAFFASQARTTRSIQAQNEQSIRLRAVVEAVGQDLQLAGARAVVDAAGVPRYIDAVETECGTGYDTCVVTDDVSQYEIQVAYATSLRTTDVCRSITYRFDATSGMLYRADLACGTSPNSTTWDGLQFEFAEAIDAFAVTFVCSDGSETGDAAECFQPNNTTTPPTDRFGIRGATITVQAASRTPGFDDDTMTVSVGMPNTRAVIGE